MEKRKIVGLINAPSEREAVLQTLRGLESEGGICARVIGLNGDCLKGVDRTRECRRLSDYSTEQELQKRVVLWIDAWADGLLVGEKSLKEALVWRATSLWWFFLPVLFPDVRRCIQYVEAFSAVIEAEEPDLLVMVDCDDRPLLPFRLNRSPDLPSRIARLTATARGCAVRLVPKGGLGAAGFWRTYLWRSLLSRSHRLVGQRLRNWVRLLLYLAASRAGRKFRDRGCRGADLIMFSNPAYWREVGRAADGAAIEEDVFAGEVLGELAKRHGWAVLDIDTEVNLPSIVQYRKFFRKVRQRPFRSLPIECFYDRQTRMEVRRGRRRLGEIWKRLRMDQGFIQSLTYRGVSLWSLLSDRLEYLFGDYATTAFSHLAAADKIVARERPRAVLMEYEESSYGRAAIVAARRQGVPSVALQHGLHGGAYIPAYYFHEVAWEEGSILSCPVPTRTAVFGEETRRLLTQVSAYPPEAVVVTGTPIFDRLLEAKRKGDAKSLRGALGLEPQRPTITVLSSIFTEVEDRVWFVETVLRALQQWPEMQSVIKLHPHENPKLWREASQELGLPPPRLYRSRLWDCIQAADAVISWYSTTILDAMLLDRPVVVLRLVGRNNPLSFIEKGGARMAGDAGELKRALAEVMGDQRIREQLAEGRRRVLQEQLYHFDGGATSRIVALLRELGERPAGEHPQKQPRESCAEKAR